MTVTWPSVLEARRWNANLRNLTARSGRSATGRDQAVFGGAGFWEVTVSEIRIHEREEAAAYRAMIARLRAGEDILLPIFDNYQAVGAGSPDATISLSANAPLRSAQISLVASGVDIQPGYHFTIGDRLHVISEVTSGPSAPPLLNQIASDSAWSDDLPWSDTVANSGTYTVKILPLLRTDLLAGEPARFRDLIVRCVIKDPGDGDIDLDLGRLGTPSLTFIESL